MPDRTISCQDCGKEFVFTEEEQNYYAEKGFQEPKRCKSCRMARKKRGPQGSGGRGRAGNRSDGGGGGRGGGGFNRW